MSSGESNNKKINHYFDDKIPDLEKKKESAVAANSKLLFFKKIRVNSANGQLIEHRFKVFVESVPVPLLSSLSNDNEIGKENNDDELDEEVIDISHLFSKNESTAEDEEEASLQDDDELCDVEAEEEIESDSSLSVFVSSNLNPLYICEVLENIAKYLAFKDLLSLRLTCKKWNYVLVPELKKKANKPVELNRGNLNKFLSTMSATPSTQQVPITKYSISDYDLKLNDLATLFSTYGRFMTYLELSIRHTSTPFTSTMLCSIFNSLIELIEFKVNDTRHPNYINQPKWMKSKPFWNQWINPSQKSFPILQKLKKIDFHLYRFQGTESEAFLIELLNSAPNLQTIQIKNKEYNYEKHNEVTLIGLKSTKTYLDKLKILHFNHFKFADFNTLIELSRNHGLALTQFNLHLLKPTADENVNLFSQFLRLQENSLKLLSVEAAQQACAVVVQKPSLKLLEELEVNYFLGGTSLQLQSSLCESNFPALKNLKFKNVDDDMSWDSEDEIAGRNKWNSFITSLCPIPTLTNLTLNFGLNSLDQMIQLGYLFPNITKLDIYLKDIQLITNIWTQWPKLNVVIIWSETPLTGSTRRSRAGRMQVMSVHNEEDNVEKVNDGLLDEVITGISVKFHGLLKMFTPTNPLDVLNKMKTQAGISDMKCLTELKLHLDNEPHFITDISAYYGFGLPNTQLTSLYIGSAAHKISHECQEVIKKSMGPDADICIEDTDDDD